LAGAAFFTGAAFLATAFFAGAALTTGAIFFFTLFLSALNTATAVLCLIRAPIFYFSVAKAMAIL
jgi:hypothetical protein